MDVNQVVYPTLWQQCRNSEVSLEIAGVLENS